MIHIDRRRIPTPLDSNLVRAAQFRIEQWFSIKSETRRQAKLELPERPQIIQQSMKALRDLFYSKCAYCESPIEDEEFFSVDWFRPPANATDLSGEGSVDHYVWLFAEWENLYCACSSCSRAKRSLFPVDGSRAAPRTSMGQIHLEENALLIDPCQENPNDHLLFADTGEVLALSRKGEVTIKVMNLNRPQLIEGRRRAWKEAFRLAQIVDDPNFFAPARPFAAACFAGRDERLRRPLQHSPERESVRELRSAEEILSTDAEAFRLTARPLRRVEIRNFRALRSLDLNFAEPASERAPWLMLLGENATGKSSVLQAIALTLAGATEASSLVHPRSVLSSGMFDGSIKVWFWDQDHAAELKFDRNSKMFRGTKGPSAIVLGYGALRYAERRPRRKEPKLSFSQVASLMEPISRIGYPGRWLLSVDDVFFDTAARALQSVLPLKDQTTMRRVGTRLFFETNGHKASLGQLSAGYQTVVGMCADIMRLLFARWKNLSSATAIVLIDELDAHLHPRWSMRIVSSLREAFPQVQFITSTHDPLALRGLRNGEAVLLLRREKGENVIADQNLPPLEGMQVDQLLTSRVFGLDSTMDPETEVLLNEFYHLRSLPYEPSRAKRLTELRSRIGDREALGRSESERLMLEAADEFIRETAARPSLRESVKPETLSLLRQIAIQGVALRRRDSE